MFVLFDEAKPSAFGPTDSDNQAGRSAYSQQFRAAATEPRPFDVALLILDPPIFTVFALNSSFYFPRDSI
jgi:hypothetical protein